MDQVPPSSPSEQAAQPRPSRFRAAWSVLRGQSLVPEQIRFEWLEYQAVFNDLLQRYSAQLARAAKAEKARIKALNEALEPPSSRPVRPQDHKSELRSRAAALRGLGIPSGTYESPGRAPPDHLVPHLEPEENP